MEIQADVVVAGAGPVGLLAAIELTLGGARVLVLERLAEPSLTIKALSLGPLGCEAVERRGMAAEVAAAEARSQAVMQQFTAQTGSDLRLGGGKFSGHFAGLPLIRKDAQREPERRARFVDQQSLEAMLAERARALGIDVRRECEVSGFEQDAAGVTVHWTASDGPAHIRCAYLLGCDGGRSTVRKLAGFDFPGTPPSLTFYQAIAEVDHPERLLPTGWRRTATGVFAYGPIPGRLFMLDFSGPPTDREAPVTHEEIETTLRHISSADVRLKALQAANRWTDNTRLVDTYRQGRVLLAGDAAHIHTPFGGQGMNLGLVDAANLGWKLAAVLRGEMPDSLLDTYTTERRPVAEAVLANTLAQVAILRPDPQAGAMREIIAHLMQFDEVNRYIGELMSGHFTRYDCGAEQDEVGRLIGDRPLGSSTLYAAMQGGHGVLLDASKGQQATHLVATHTRRVRCITIDSGPSLLVRPDACVAWQGKDGSTAGLAEAVQCWFGPAAA
ncbi:FAD-dependent monooxygenase [Chitinimonas sp.]|uniref:FAD-dependent monooxygenase n=1 Tax=Chitinimonas sp. TaxID=1934313 RepID=UPI002F955CD3